MIDLKFVGTGRPHPCAVREVAILGQHAAVLEDVQDVVAHNSEDTLEARREQLC